MFGNVTLEMGLFSTLALQGFRSKCPITKVPKNGGTEVPLPKKAKKKVEQKPNLLKKSCFLNP